MMDLLCTLLELLLLVLSVAIGGKSDGGDKGKGRTEPVSDTPDETLEFIDCTVCGKPNQVGRVSCSICGALQESART
jgi:hypothetical protein